MLLMILAFGLCLFAVCFLSLICPKDIDYLLMLSLVILSRKSCEGLAARNRLACSHFHEIISFKLLKYIFIAKSFGFIMRSRELDVVQILVENITNDI